MNGHDIAKEYSQGHVVGWLETHHPGSVQKYLDLITPYRPSLFQDYHLFKGSKSMLYQVTRKILGKDTQNYGQEIGDPFIAGTKVLMANGEEKNIEDIEVGENVINHKGEKARVTNVIKKNFTGNLVTIKVKGWHRTLTATETHHGMILPCAAHRFKYSGIERRKFGDMNIGDYSLTPFTLQDNQEGIAQNNTPYGLARKIVDINTEYVEDHHVYCITTENEFTAIFNGIAQFQCVSFGAKNATEYLSCCDMLMRKDREQFKPVFPPYYYGTGRVYVGGWDNDYSDGSLGSYMAEAVKKYGTLFSDEKDVPKYSGSVAKEFGAKRLLLDRWKPTAIKYLVKDTAQINSWEDLVTAITNGYPCPTASSIGYNMEPSSDGFHKQTDSWSHQMCFIGVDDNDKDPYALLLNSWGDSHGHLKDFDNGEDLPTGVLRVRRADALKHIKAKETYAYSQFDGFPTQRIEQALLMLI